MVFIGAFLLAKLDGCTLTWDKGSPDPYTLTPPSNIKEHIDWGFADHDLRAIFPDVHLHHLPIKVSDHLPILAYLTMEEIHHNGFGKRNKNHRLFFESMWVQEEDFKAVVEKARGLGVEEFQHPRMMLV